MLPMAERYLLIKAWGYGFWSDVDHVMGACLLAEALGRRPLVHWGGNSKFTNEPADDAFVQFFEPVSPLTLADVARPGMSYFPPKWTATNIADPELHQFEGPHSRMTARHFVGRTEDVAVSDFYVQVFGAIQYLPASHPMAGRPADVVYDYLIRKYLKPTPAIQREVGAFHAARLAGSRFAAVHLRGSDKIVEHSALQRVNEQYPSYMDTIPNDWRIFLLTDSEPAAAALKARYGERLVQTDCRRTSTELGTHYLDGIADRAALGREVMIDTCLAVRADAFLGNGSSNVSAYTDHFRRIEGKRSQLLIPNQHLSHLRLVWDDPA